MYILHLRKHMGCVYVFVCRCITG